MHTKKHNAGFTLVELAIVLVIIGLLVGGVLVGQDLIKASEIRSTVKQMEDYNAAVNTFRTKFGGYPGDLVANKAASFGFVTRAGSTGRGDGDGLIEGYAGANNVLGGENTLVWVDLSAADLVPDAFTTGTDAASLSVDTSSEAAALLPQTKVRENTYIHITVSQGKNFYMLSNVETDGSGVITTSAGLTPLEAKSIDEKVDDGYPLSGTTVAITALTATDYTEDTATAAASGVCVADLATDDYNVVEANRANVNCQIVARASF